MGTSGTFNTSNSHVKYNIKVYQNWQSAEGNYSNVTVKVDFWRDNSGYTTYGSGTVWCKINGTTYSASVSTSQKITSSGITLYSQTLNIGHEADGSKNLSVSAWISLNTPLSSSEQGFSEWLTTIPRSSQPSLSASTATMGENLTIYTNRASGNFTHSLYFQINSGGWNVIATNVATEYTWNVPRDFANRTPNSTSLSVEILCETYNNGSYIGTRSVYFTANVPSDIVPTINGVTLTENTAGIAAKFGGYVQGKSTIKGVISASGAYSSTIKNYEIKLNGQSFNSANFTTNPLTSSGSCNVTITDTRNRTASQSVSYSVINYINPTINTFAVIRCDENGVENDEGGYAKCTLKSSISSVDNKNNKIFQILYKKLTDSLYTTINLSNDSYSYNNTQIIQADVNSEYEFIFRVTDYFSGVQKSLNLGTAFTLLDFNKSGRALAVGKVSTEDNAFDIILKTMFRNYTLFHSVTEFHSLTSFNSETNFNSTTTINGEQIIFQSGSWTPEIRSHGGENPSHFVQYRYGRYKRFNNFCYVSFHGKWTIANSGTGYACITGLPYVSASGFNGQSLSLHEMFGAISTNPTRCGIILDNSTQINLNGENGAYASQWQTGDVWIGFSGVYMIAT